MPLDLLNLFENSAVFTFVKIAVLVFLAIYIIFTFVILTQVKVMNRIFTEMFASTVLMSLALVHLVLAISLFIIALVIL